MYSKIAVISPSTILTAKIRQEIERQNLNIIVRQASRENAVYEVEELLIKGVKILISRGITASILRHNFDIPVIDIKHTFFDCYSAYKNAKQYSDKIAFLATSEKFELMIRKSMDLLEGAIIIPIHHLEPIEVIETKLNKMKESGIEVAIGGLSLEKKVFSLGIKYIMTEADNEAIIEAIDDALHLFKIEMEKEERRLELEYKYEMINSIFDCASEGMISIDQHGVITNINNNARRILGNYAEGKFIQEIIPAEIFIDAVKNGVPTSNEIINFGKSSLVVNIEPIIVENQTIGAVATIQQSKKIQAVEQKIRHTMLNKGHVADKTFNDIIGESEVIRTTKELAKRYASVDSTILILGETGTGKEIFAKSIHSHSERKAAPFVAINCAAFPSSILESELFGYVKGAFTGALNQGKAGIFELAHRGTIFLDEISEAPLEVQLKLLRVIQERKIIRIGDDKVIPIDVRIIAASNKDLKQQIKLGLFREDLYYRICVLELALPSLRDRREDIPSLIRYFIESSQLPVKGITHKAIEMLGSAGWPGNIRQLSNIIERLIVICDDEIITSDMVEKATDLLNQSESSLIEGRTKAREEASSHMDRTASAALTEEELIKRALMEAKGERRLAAQRLGISTTTLWRKIKKCKGIDSDFLDLIKYAQLNK